jgi:Fe2+ or Zn2+ uptake regulation protein
MLPCEVGPFGFVAYDYQSSRDFLQFCRNSWYFCSMSQSTDQLHATLAANRQSLTRPRRLVFDALQGQDPMSMSTLVRKCAAEIDRASVYRTVALFEQLGVIHRVQVGWKYLLELSDSFQHHHHHLHCVICGTVTAIEEDPALEERLRVLAAGKEFEAQDHSIEIRGVCRSCRHNHSA